jgi:hypothetical protein
VDELSEAIPSAAGAVTLSEIADRVLDVAIIGTLLPSALLDAAGDANPLLDQRLEREAALRTLLRDRDVERWAWAPAG